MPLATAATLKGRSAWAAFSLLDALLLFFVLLISQAISGTIGQYLPITLLQFVMVLFAIELLTEAAASAEKESLLKRSARETIRHISRACLLFASCYLVSLGILYIGAFSARPGLLLADISLYIVVVSVSLALLLLFRED